MATTTTQKDLVLSKLLSMGSVIPFPTTLTALAATPALPKGAASTSSFELDVRETGSNQYVPLQIRVSILSDTDKELYGYLEIFEEDVEGSYTLVSVPVKSSITVKKAALDMMIFNIGQKLPDVYAHPTRFAYRAQCRT